MKKPQYQHIVILTGAGISAESGIKTFRDQNGLWEGHDVLAVASPQGFERDSELVYQFYNQRRQQLISDEISPNPAHHALAELEKKFKGKVTLITQNVDDLHERAGSHNIYHMHGEILKARCQKTGQIFEHRTDLSAQSLCPSCQEPGHLRPHIVWFGEMPLCMGEIERALTDCDLFISVGTSGVVYPAALFIEIVRSKTNAHTIEINREETQISPHFHEHITADASHGVTELVSKILADQ